MVGPRGLAMVGQEGILLISLQWPEHPKVFIAGYGEVIRKMGRKGGGISRPAPRPLLGNSPQPIALNFEFDVKRQAHKLASPLDAIADHINYAGFPEKYS